ncbi:MAG TPA: metal ABC transporter substrate-binding protein [Tepidisphaeraceae bacterium]|jgi:zinc transport system substrate-binding protein
MDHGRTTASPGIFLLLLTLLPLTLAPAGCDRSGLGTSQVSRIKVISTVYPMADIAKQVGGPFVDVSWMIEGGQSFEGVQSTPELRGRLNDAQLLITNGTERWANQDAGDPFQRQRLIRLDLLNSTRQTPGIGRLWLDPVIAKDLARELCARLLVARSEHEQYFRDRTNEFVADLDATVQQYEVKFVAPRNRKVLVMGPEYNPLLYRFGLEPIQPVEASATTLSDEAVTTLRDASKQNGTTLLLIPSDLPAVISRDIAFRTGLQVVPIDSLGSSADGGRTYITMLRSNLDQLLAATTFQ